MTEEMSRSAPPEDLRERAEDIAREVASGIPENLDALSTQETQKVLHELRVHQIELEMQNEELRRVQGELAASRARYFDLYDLAPVGYLSVSEQGLIVEANLTLATMLGVAGATGSLLMQPLTHFVLPEDEDVYYLYRTQPFETGTPQVCELRMVREDGGWFWASLEATAALEADGATLCRVAVSDITERKQAEEALRQSEAKFSKAFHASPDAVLITRVSDGRLVEVNEGFAKLSGFESDEALASSALALDLWAEPGDRERCIAALKSDGSVSGMDFRFRVKSGEILQCLYAGALLSVDGEPHMLSVVRDITESKQAEEALLEARDDWESTFDSLTDMVTIHDQDFNVVRANGAARRMLRLPLSGNLTNAKCFTCYHGAEKPPEWCPSYRSLETGQPCSYELFEPHLNRHLEIRAIPRFDTHRRCIGLVHVVRDITEPKQAEEEKARLEAQLRQAQKMESVGRLAGGVAHDFNNMLGVILGHAEMALEQVDPAQPLHADLTEIRQAAQRSADLTRQLLAFARKQIIAPKVLDLNETVGSMLNMLKRLIGEDIDLTWQPQADLWPVEVDPSQIDQILANLCVNARDAINGVGKMTIETANGTFDKSYCAKHPGFMPGEYVRLGVRDDGCGMEKETLAQLFEPFFTTKGVGEGTGLGLAMVYGIVKQNNGFTSVYSEPDKGTTLTIYLPRHAAKAEQPRKESPTAPAARGHETILVVEDEPAILKMTTRMLESQGYTVLAASTPGEAIRLAREHTGEIPLLITDVVMPEMNGRDLAKNLLSLYPDLRRLFMSGYTANVIARDGVLDEGVYFIQKPFSRQDLAAKVRDALDSEQGKIS